MSHLFFFMIFIRSGLGVGLQQATLPPFFTVGAPRPAGGGQWFHKTEEWALLLQMHAIGYCSGNITRLVVVSVFVSRGHSVYVICCVECIPIFYGIAG